MVDHEVEDYDGDGSEGQLDDSDILRILSMHSHRGTTRWAIVNEEVFMNGRHVQTVFYYQPKYEKPSFEFEANWRMTQFEAAAIAKAYVMQGIEDELEQVRASN